MLRSYWQGLGHAALAVARVIMLSLDEARESIAVVMLYCSSILRACLGSNSILNSNPIHNCHPGVDWKVVSRFCDISRSYKTFQNPNDESGPTTWKDRLQRLLRLPAFIPQGLRRAPRSLWHTISGRERDLKLGKNFQPGT